MALNLVLIVDFVAVMNIVFLTTSNAKCINVALSQRFFFKSIRERNLKLVGSCTLNKLNTKYCMYYRIYKIGLNISCPKVCFAKRYDLTKNLNVLVGWAGGDFILL